jgi:mono/diheme cytochrome c family protein
MLTTKFDDAAVPPSLHAHVKIPFPARTFQTLRRKTIATALAICAGTALSSWPSAAAVETMVERGAYLTKSVAACGRCHTPRDGNSLPIPGLGLGGGSWYSDPAVGYVVAPNITPDPETGIGRWTQAQIVHAIRNGVRPDGTIIGPPMPFSAYRELSDRDVNAIAAYLRTAKPIRNPLPRSQYAITPAVYGEMVTHVAEPQRADRLAYGAYLAGPVAHCIGCHTPLREGGQQLDRRRAFTGGRQLHAYGQPGVLVPSRNITPDPEEGIGRWSDAEIKRATVVGIRPDGTHLSPAMPYPWYRQMAPADIEAIVAYLRTVKPLKNSE